MTIIVAIRTGTAAVLAADSKVTTQAPAGRNDDGTIRYLPQTYDSAVKLTSDLSETAIAAFAGHGNIGEQNATDYFSKIDANLNQDPSVQDQRVQEILADMALVRREFWAELRIPIEQAPSTTMLLVAPPAGATAPRIWRIDLVGSDGHIDEILQNAGIWFEGSIDMAMTLLYGCTSAQAVVLRRELGLDEETFQGALNNSRHTTAISQINFWAMPLQDAIDFAVFCARVQVEMDRFRPGMAACGGPIDLMALEMAPRPRIRSFPGKALHHPLRATNV